jgi:NAD(P)-dependent dehydrogenase (short-subunit alcohol dehydrogenase family)
MTGENDPVEDLTEVSGPSVAVITGASSGIGLAAAEELARRGWAVTLVGRDPARLDEAIRRVEAQASQPVTGYRCDFARLDDVRDLAAKLQAAHPRIDVLANNAGGTAHQRSMTVDGFESIIQTNHLAGFLLTLRLRENLRGGRVINTSSAAHTQGRLDPDNLNGGGRFVPILRYGAAKQANILFTVEAARQWSDIQSTAFHPGIVRTRFGNDSALYRVFYKAMPGLRTPTKGAETLVWLATVDRSAVTSGGYYMDRRAVTASKRATDPATAARLWEVSLAAVGL